MEKALLRTLAACAAAAPFVIAYGTGPVRFVDFASLPQSAFAAAFPALLAAWVFLDGAAEGRLALPRVSGPGRAAAAFLAWCALSLAWAHHRYEGVLLWLSWAACAAVFLPAVKAVRKDKDAAFLADALILSASAVSLLGSVQYARLLDLDAIPQVLAPSATFGHRNFAVQYVAAVFPLAAAAWWREKDALKTCLRAATGAIMLLYLVYAGSRAGAVMLAAEALCAAVLAAYAFLSAKRAQTPPLKPGRTRVLSAAAALSAVLALSFVPPPAEQVRLGHAGGRAAAAADPALRGQVFGDDWDPAEHPVPVNNIRTRIVLWRNTLEMIKDRPLLGTGLGGFAPEYPRYLNRGLRDRMFGEHAQPEHPHNELLSIAAETGLIGLALALWLLWAASASAARAYRSADPARRSHILALASGAAGILAAGLTSFPFHKALPPLLLALYGGAASGLSHESKRDGESRPVLKGSRLAAAAAGAAASALLLCAWHARRVAAEAAHSKALYAQRARDWKDVVHFSRKALFWEPYRARLAYPLGKAYAMLGRLPESAAAFSLLLAAYPNHINSRVGLGLVLTQMGDTERARVQFELALGILPGFARAHNGLGLVYSKSGRLEEAREAYRRAAESDPENPVYRYRLAVTAGRLGDRETERREMDAYKRLASPR